MPKEAKTESESQNKVLTTSVAAITGGITIASGSTLLSSKSAIPVAQLAHGVRNGDSTDRGLAFYYYQILQQSTSLYRL